MSDRIAGRPAGSTEAAPRGLEPASARQAEKVAGEVTTAKDLKQSAKDAFERPAQRDVNQALQARLQTTSPKTMAQVQKLQFTSDDLAYLAQTFSALVAQHPGLNRLRRAQMFARAILKRGRIRHMFLGISEADIEQMSDAIGDALEGSPLFGQLIDDVSEGTGKFNA